MFSLKGIKKAGIISLVLAGSLYAEEGGILERVEQEGMENGEKSAYEEEQSKSGFFLGIEGNLGGATIERNDLTPLGVLHRQSDPSFVFDGGLKFGYQHYFNKEALGVKQAFGLNVGLYVGAGNPVEQNFKGFSTMSFPDFEIIETLKTSYVPIKTGIEINFLWDFLERGEHTLGLTAGIGYRFGYYLSTLNSNNFKHQQNSAQGKEVLSSNHKSPDLMTHSIYPQIGLHYYFGNHQFEFNYRYLGSIPITQKASLADTIVESNETQYETKILDRSYFSFGYSYRF